MTKKRLYIIIALMSISLLGIILLQYYWIRTAIAARQAQFDSQVSAVLNGISDRLQTDEAVRLLAERVLPPVDTANRLKTAPRKVLHTSEVTVLEMDDTARRDFSAALQPLTRDIRARVAKDTFSIHVLQVDSVVNHDTQFLSIQAGRVEAKQSQFGDVIDRMMIAFQQKDKSLRNRIDSARLDSMIKAEMEEHSMNIPYQFAVQSDDSVFYTTVADRQKLHEEAYQGKLFSDDIIPSNDRLLLYFPGKAGYVLRSTGLILPVSILLLLVILFSFRYTLQAILRQKKLSEMKNDFVNNMTHEFKTPIATISLATDAMDNPKVYSDPSRLRYYVGVIREENQRLNMQVEQVLQMAQLDREAPHLSLNPIHAEELIEKAVTRFALQADASGGQIRTSLQATRPIIEADEMYLAQVINNLLDNAIKYSRGAPDIIISTVDTEQGLAIAVQDKGIGMSREAVKHIFDSFYREHTGDLHDVKGFGLGLSYVKAIVKAHQAEIRVDSEPGQGSTFTLYFPHSQKERLHEEESTDTARGRRA